MYCTNNSNSVYHSTDGINWTSATPALGSTPTGIGFINGNFVIFATSSTSFGYTSNPTSWNINSMATAFSCGSIAYGGGQLIAFGTSGQAYFTENGQSMTLVHNGNEIAFSLTGTYACYDGQKSILRTDSSSSGILYRSMASKYGGYTSRTLPGSSVNWQSMIYGPSLGIWVAIASNTTQAASSLDGNTWTMRTMPSSTTWTHLAFGAGTFVAIAQNTSSAYSTNGTSWTAQTLPSTYSGIVYGDKFVAVGASVAGTSPDGITWTSRTFGITANAVTYGNGLYVAVGSSTASTSPDGIT